MARLVFASALGRTSADILGQHGRCVKCVPACCDRVEAWAQEMWCCARGGEESRRRRRPGPSPI